MKKLVFLLTFLLTTPSFAGVSVSPTIHYGSDDHQIVQVYEPDSCKTKSCPVVMWVHGGGWRNGDMTGRAAKPLFDTWANQGIVMVGVNYRLSPDIVHPAHVKDIAAAINWVHQNISQYGGDAKRISLLGHSAGAHLVALVATNPSYLSVYKLTPQDLANVFPIDTASFDLTNPSRFVKSMINQAFGTDEAVLQEASPNWNVHNGGKYPAFMIAATENRPDAVETSKILQSKLKAAGASADLMVVNYPGMRQLQAHGAIARDLANVDSGMTKSLMARVLKGQ